MLVICSWNMSNLLVFTLLSQSIMILSPPVVVNCQKLLSEGQRPCEFHHPHYNFDWLDLVQDLAASLSCCNFTSAIAMPCPVDSISWHSSSSILCLLYSFYFLFYVPWTYSGVGNPDKAGPIKNEFLYWLLPTTKKFLWLRLKQAPGSAFYMALPVPMGS